MHEVSTFRLYLLRAMYLLLVVGLGTMIWPLILNHKLEVEHMRGVVWSLLGAVALLAILGLRYPLQMLPLLLFELVWKTIWLLSFGLPLWRADAFTPGTRQTWFDCLAGLILLVVIPWGYVWRNYVTRPGDRWGRAEKRRDVAPGGAAG
ncbi:MAG: hypothetical protein ACYC7A_14870 [Thermoanaerobaculia bacterium]